MKFEDTVSAALASWQAVKKYCVTVQSMLSEDTATADSTVSDAMVLATPNVWVLVPEITFRVRSTWKNVVAAAAFCKINCWAPAMATEVL